MPLIHVKYVRLNSERGKRFNSSDTEHDLLAHAHLEVAAVKLRGDESILGAVFRNVGVEKIDVHAAHPQFPKPGENFAIQNRHRDQELCFAPANFPDWQVIKVLIQINRCLNRILVDVLPEIAMTIKQTDRNEVQIQIARGFAMVAGKDPEAA